MRKLLRAVLAVFARQRSPAEIHSPHAAAPTASEAPQNGGRKRTIRAELPADRLSNGTLTVQNEDSRVVLGPHPVTCAVDKVFAARAGSPDADRRRPFGDVPTGRYCYLGLARPGDVALPTDENTGLHPILVFRAIDGEAAMAEAAGRGDLLLHGGPAEPTLGTLRLADDILAAVLASVGPGPGGSTVVTLVVADSPQMAAGPPPQPRRTTPSGPFPPRPEAAARSPSLEPRRLAETTTDPMDGFLLSYLIGWPVNATPGSLLGAVLHGEERRHDDSAERLRAADVPVLRDDGQNPQDQSKDTGRQPGGSVGVGPEDLPRVDGGHKPADATETPQADTPPQVPDRTSTPHYVPSGGAYDRY